MSVPHEFVTGEVAHAADLNEDFDAAVAAQNAVGATADLSGISIFLGTKYGMSGASGASSNTDGFNAAATAAVAGGRILIPLATYQINPLNELVDGVDIESPSRLTELVVNANGNLFFVAGDGGNGMGIGIRNLTIKYMGGVSGYPLYATNCQNMVGERLFFNSCAAAFFDDHALQCGVKDSTLDAFNVNNLIWNVLSGSQCFLRNNVMRCAGGANNNNKAAQIQSVSTLYIEDNHFSHMDYGFEFLKSWNDVFISRNHMNPRKWSVMFNPPTGAANQNAIFTDNIHVLSASAVTTFPGGTIGTGAFANSSTDGVSLNNETYINWTRDGLLIAGCHLVKVNKGRYSANGQGGGDYAGIRVTGGDVVEIEGANCRGDYEGFSTRQPWGMIVDLGSNTTILRVKNVDLTNNALGPLKVVGTPTTIWFKDCPGLTDQHKVLNGGVIPLTATTAASLGYYGTSYISFWGATSYTLNGVTKLITQGILKLDPYDQISFAGSPSGDWIGND